MKNHIEEKLGSEMFRLKSQERRWSLPVLTSFDHFRPILTTFDHFQPVLTILDRSIGLLLLPKIQ